MFRYAAVAAILAIAACSDNATAPAPAAAAPGAQYPAAVKYDTARGMIAARAADDASLQVFLVTITGDSLRLIGPVADVLANVAGLELWVEGRLGADGAMDVVSYAFRGTDAINVCLDPDHRSDDGKCQIAQTGIKPRKR